MTEFFTHDNIRFAYEAPGDGPPVLLLHGLGGDRSGGLALADELTGWRRLAPDLRGHGETEPVGPEDRFTFDVFTDDMGALLDERRIDRAVIAGVSMGAGVALRFALRYPSRTAALILVRPAWLHFAVTENMRPYVGIAGLLRSMPAQAALAAYRASPGYALIKEQSGHAADTLCAQILAPAAAERAVRLDRMPRSTPYSDPGELSGVSAPAWVIGCSGDFLHPMSFAEEWARHIPGARLHEVISTARDLPGHRKAVRDLTRSILTEIG